MARVLVAGYDGTSRVPGTSDGAARLWSALSEQKTATTAPWERTFIREDSKSSLITCRKIKARADAERFNLALGGEHLITFPLIESLQRSEPRLRLVVLDAHHDAYDYPLLTHFSLFHFLWEELKIPTLIVGVRHEVEKAAPGCQLIPMSAVRAQGLEATLARIQAFTEGAPFYLSVDLDVLDPSALPAVSDPIPGGLSIAELGRAVDTILGWRPLAMDLVEYNGVRDPGGQALRGLQPILRSVAQWLC